MTLLIPYLVFSVLGLSAWLIGHFFEYTGIAAVGAIILLATGGAVAVTDLEARDGETINKTYSTVNGETVVDEEIVEPEYSRVDQLDQFGPTGSLSLGGFQMILGGLLFTRRLNEEVS